LRESLIGRLFAQNKANLRQTAQRSLNHFHGWVPEIPLPDRWRGGVWVLAVAHHLERIDWVPSPPLAPDDGPIDIEHLGRMTLGDAALEHEVLAMFSAQTVGLIAILATMPADATALAHTLKGSARAIGAFQVADAAGRVETALRDGNDPAQALAELNDAIAQARSAIDAMLRRS
jgi:HPt (histidine-containing phosphotransfer) domain-containing protein